MPVSDDRQTVERYLTRWLDAIRPHLRPRSYVRYAEAVRLHIVPALGKVKLSKLTARQIEATYSAQLAAGLAPATVQRTHAVLRKALNDAVRYEMLARNFASHARAPRVERTEQDTWTAEQARTFLRAVEGDPLEAFYSLAINTGARRGGRYWPCIGRTWT